MWWPFRKYPPYFDKCEVARVIYDMTRDETLVSAMTIALYAKYGGRTMKDLADATRLGEIMTERVEALGNDDLRVLVRIFERQIIKRVSNDRDDSVRSRS